MKIERNIIGLWTVQPSGCGEFEDDNEYRFWHKNDWNVIYEPLKMDNTSMLNGFFDIFFCLIKELRYIHGDKWCTAGSPLYCTISLHRNPRQVCSAPWVCCVLVCLFLWLYTCYMLACCHNCTVYVHILHKGMKDRQGQILYLFYSLVSSMIVLLAILLCVNLFFAFVLTFISV